MKITKLLLAALILGFCFNYSGAVFEGRENSRRSVEVLETFTKPAPVSALIKNRKDLRATNLIRDKASSPQLFQPLRGNNLSRVALVSDCSSHGTIMEIVEALEGKGDNSFQMQICVFGLAVGIRGSYEDYGDLIELLKQHRWALANEFTKRIIASELMNSGHALSDDLSGPLFLYVSRSRIGGIKNYPCESLGLIDRIWWKYSGKRFGFSVQRRIWFEQVKEKGGPLLGDRIYLPVLFSTQKRLGWRTTESAPITNPLLGQIYISRAEFTQDAPVGHLPIIFNNSGSYLTSNYNEDFWSRMGSCRFNFEE